MSTPRRPRLITAACPICPVMVMEGRATADVGLLIAIHCEHVHPEIVYGEAEAMRRRLAAEMNARRN